MNILPKDHRPLAVYLDNVHTIIFMDLPRLPVGPWICGSPGKNAELF